MGQTGEEDQLTDVATENGKIELEGARFDPSILEEKLSFGDPYEQKRFCFTIPSKVAGYFQNLLGIWTNFCFTKRKKKKDEFEPPAKKMRKQTYPFGSSFHFEMIPPLVRL